MVEHQQVLQWRFDMIKGDVTQYMTCIHQDIIEDNNMKEYNGCKGKGLVNWDADNSLVDDDIRIGD